MAAGGSFSSKINYDVFISFRGEDTRSNFTSHLYSSLCRAKIKAFIDENDLKKGNEISPTLLRAIEESKLCLIILSKDYASSRWCLDELAHILQCKKTDGQSQVLPVFYNVDPSDVRKQQGSYAVAFDKLEEHFEDEKLQAWRVALTKIANLSGWDLKSYRSESTLVDTIVVDVIKKLEDTSMAREDYLQGLVGVTKRIKEIESLLHIGSLDVRSVGIWGLGGIGKTTLAHAVFCRLSSQFEACSFLKNIREVSKKHEPDYLKNQLYFELLNVKSPHSVTLQFEKDRLRQTKVLIVFDDVDDPQQLEQLFNASWFFEENNWIWASLPRKTQKFTKKSPIRPISPLSSRAEPRAARRAESRKPTSRHVSIAAAPQTVGPASLQPQRATRPVGSACSPAYARVARTAAPPREFPSRARQPDLLSLPRGSRVPASIQPDRATCPCCPPHTRVSRARSLSARVPLPRASSLPPRGPAVCHVSPAREWPCDTCPTLQNVMIFLP